jgi:hypothetical protein
LRSMEICLPMFCWQVLGRHWHSSDREHGLSTLGSLDGKESISSPEGGTVTLAIVILLIIRIKDGSGFRSP